MDSQNSIAPAPMPMKEREKQEFEVIVEEELNDVETQIEEPFNLVVWDDKIHDENYFISSFVHYFGMPEPSAMEKAREVVDQGRSVLVRGARSDMELHVIVLDMNYKISATVEPGL